MEDIFSSLMDGQLDFRYRERFVKQNGFLNGFLTLRHPLKKNPKPKVTQFL